MRTRNVAMSSSLGVVRKTPELNVWRINRSIGIEPSRCLARVIAQLRILAAGVRSAITRKQLARSTRSASVASAERANHVDSSVAQRTSLASSAACACRATSSRPPKPAISFAYLSSGSTGKSFDSSPSNQPRRPMNI